MVLERRMVCNMNVKRYFVGLKSFASRLYWVFVCLFNAMYLCGVCAQQKLKRKIQQKSRSLLINSWQAGKTDRCIGPL